MERGWGDQFWGQLSSSPGNLAVVVVRREEQENHPVADALSWKGPRDLRTVAGVMWVLEQKRQIQGRHVDLKVCQHRGELRLWDKKKTLPPPQQVSRMTL